MQSLHTRLDPIKQEVLDYTDTFGIFGAMRKYRIASWDCFHGWLKGATGNEKFGIYHRLTSDGRQTIGEQLVNAFLLKVEQLEVENERLRQTIEFLRLQLSPSKDIEELEALAVMEACRV